LYQKCVRFRVKRGVFRRQNTIPSLNLKTSSLLLDYADLFLHSTRRLSVGNELGAVAVKQIRGLLNLARLTANPGAEFFVSRSAGR